MRYFDTDRRRPIKHDSDCDPYQTLFKCQSTASADLSPEVEISTHTWWYTVLQKLPGLRRSQRPKSASARLATSEPKLTMMFNLFWDVRVSTHSLFTGSQVDSGPCRSGCGWTCWENGRVWIRKNIGSPQRDLESIRERWIWAWEVNHDVRLVLTPN